MRELSAAEMMCVSGGLIPTLPPTVVHPDPGSGGGGNSGGGYSPPSTGPDPSGGGSSSGSNPGGGLSSSQAAGVLRIKNELGIDLTPYAMMSPTLANSISIATATFNWHFAYSSNGSSAAYSATSSVEGTIYITDQVQGNVMGLIQQLSHELGHVDHRVYDDPTKVSSTQYVNDYLKGEGYAVINNERVRHEILSASGQDVLMASADPKTTAPLYESQYNRLTSGQATLDQVVTSIGNTYGAYEHVSDGRTYRQVFLDNYHSGGGKN